MKLFTQEIDRKLFSQYNLGSDLSKQMVVAKIFNPYGAGRWFLINSDPQDPDYLWAIVDLFDIELGSVSRTELESIRIGKHSLPLERDLYFKPINAQELLNGLMQGDYYKKGGLVHNQNKEMLENQAKEFMHHSKELNSLVGKTKDVDAWVVAKAERATTDLSDITHYLDGRLEQGGSLEKMYEEMRNQSINVRMKIISVVGVDEAHYIIMKDYVINPFDLIESAVRKKFITIDEIDKNLVNSAVEEAEDIDNSYRDSGEGIGSSDMNAFISNMLNGAGIKIGVVNDRYTRLANGGLLETYKGHAIVETNNVIEVVSPSGSRFIIGLDDSKMSGSRKSIEMTRAEELKSAREYIDWTLETQKGRMAKGGMMAKGGEVSVDLFEFYDQQPPKLKKIVNKWSSKYDEDELTYKQTEKFLKEVEAIGYTFDYGLDNMPYGLRPIGTEIEIDWKYGGMMSKGGMLKAILVHKEFGVEYYKNGSLIKPTKEEKLKWELYGLPNDIEKIEQSFETTIDEFVGKTKKEIQSKSDENITSGKYDYLGTNPNLNLIFDDKMAMGGATFQDKVNAISKRLEGTKVPTRLKKDYGATYDKKEAKQAGQRIAGSMIKKLKMKMKNK